MSKYTLKITEATNHNGKPVSVGDVVGSDSLFLVHIGMAVVFDTTVEKEAKAEEKPKAPSKGRKK
jgi:hypothetical protein